MNVNILSQRQSQRGSPGYDSGVEGEDGLLVAPEQEGGGGVPGQHVQPGEVLTGRHLQLSMSGSDSLQRATHPAHFDDWKGHDDESSLAGIFLHHLVIIIINIIKIIITVMSSLIITARLTSDILR